MTIPFLIVNADDLGLSPGVNRGIIEAHERGIVTSASLMVRTPAAGAAANWARQRPSLSLGLHLDLGRWIYRDGSWRTAHLAVPLDDAEAVRRAVGRQVAAFRSLTGADPTHLDSHQHVHRSEPVRAIALRWARTLGIPLRGCDARVRHRGDFYGQTKDGRALPEGITVDRLVEIIGSLPPGVTELGCHPGIGDEADGAYGVERRSELEVLCDPRVRSAIEREGVELRSFHDAFVSTRAERNVPSRGAEAAPPAVP